MNSNTLKLIILGFASASILQLSSFNAASAEVPPQVILIAERAQRSPWHQGMTLAAAVAKMGGVSSSTVSLIRKGNIEVINIAANPDRELQPWDIIVVGRVATTPP